MASDQGGGDGSAWERTLEELGQLEAALQEDGWEVVAVPAGHVAPVPPGAGGSERFGLVHVVSGAEAEPFEDAYEAGTFAEYEVFRRRVGNRLFLVTKLTASAERVAILLAGTVDTTQMGALVQAAASRGEVHTHVQLLDGTHLGSFSHDDPSLFFPSLEVSTEG